MNPFIDYLDAKAAIDDRTLDPEVQRALLTALRDREAVSSLDVLEVGAGIGTMIERLERWSAFRAPTRYTALDLSPENVAEARRRLVTRGFAPAHDTVSAEAGATPPLVRGHLAVTPLAGDLYGWLSSSSNRYDLIVAHAVLDLFDLDAVLPPLLAALRPGGLLFSTLNFDGETRFEPASDLAYERHVEAAYHRTMDARIIDGRPSGDSLCGRHLVQRLPELGMHVLADGRSDWHVKADSEGNRVFLRFIVDTVADALDGLDPSFPDWVIRRRNDIAHGQLHLYARHVDVLARKPS